MELKKIIKTASKLANAYRVTNGKKFRLKNVDPDDTLAFKNGSKPRAKAALAAGIEALAELQKRLLAQDKWAALFIFQAMDDADKDNVIDHLKSAVNPQGCQIFSFKALTGDNSFDHDYLRRYIKSLPERGHIGIFNRSYYEEVLAVRTHPEFLEKEKLPPELITKSIWRQRFKDMRSFERYLAHNGVAVCKFFLHTSKKEQKKRFLERLDDLGKHWKISSADTKERELWRDYMQAYSDMIRNTATKYAPWYVVPANNNWFARVIAAAAVIETLAGLDLKCPKVSEKKVKQPAEPKIVLMHN